MNDAPQFPQTDRFVAYPELRAITGLGRTTVWRMERAIATTHWQDAPPLSR